MTVRRILVAAIMIASAAGCGGGPPPLDLPPHAMVLRLADVDDVPTLHPAAGYDTASWTFEQAIFDTLVRYGDGNIELEPDIATSWGKLARRDDLYISYARRRALFRRPRRHQRGLSLLERADPATRSRGMEYYRGIVGAEISSRIGRRTSAASKRPTARRSFSI